MRTGEPRPLRNPAIGGGSPVRSSQFIDPGHPGARRQLGVGLGCRAGLLPPRHRTRLIYRLHHYRGRKGERKSFIWQEYRDLLTAAHHQLPGGNVILIWDDLNVHLKTELRAFTVAQPWLGSRLPRDPQARQVLEDLAEQACRALGGQERRGTDLPVRGACATGRIAVRWTTSALYVREHQRPSIDPETARIELCRHVHAFGPTTPTAFAWWAGAPAPDARKSFDLIADELAPVALGAGPDR